MVIEFSRCERWVVFPITGMITAPVIPIGEAPDMYIVKESDLTRYGGVSLKNSLNQSFESFGFDKGVDVTLLDPKMILIPVVRHDAEALRNVLMMADLALATINKKYFSAKCCLISWDSDSGRAVGASYETGEWSPIVRYIDGYGPAIVRSIGKDFWDSLIGSVLRKKLTPLAESLVRNLEWERASESAGSLTQRFAFMWIALESMLPPGEVSEGAVVRRLALFAGAPTGADTKVILENPIMSSVFKGAGEQFSKEWRLAIKEMYRYRCAIVHDGSSSLNSTDVDHYKVDWFYYLAKQINSLLQRAVVQALCDSVNDVEKFWGEFAIHFIYGRDLSVLDRAKHKRDELIQFDWRSSRYRPFI